MIRKLLIVVVAVAVVLAATLALYARSVLGSDSVRAALEAQLTAAFGRRTTIGEAGASIFPRVALTLRDVRVGDPPDIQLQLVAISTGLGGLFSRRVEDAEIAVTGGRVSLRAAAAIAGAGASPPPGGGPRGAASPQAPPASDTTAFTVASVRSIAIDGVEISDEDDRIAISARSSYDAGALQIDRLTVQSDATELDISGTLDTRTLEGRLDVRGSRANLDELVGLAAGLAAAPPGARDGATVRRRMAAKVDLDQGTFSGYAFSSLRAELALDGSTIELKPLSFAAFTGDFAGAVTVRTAGAQPAVQVRGQARGIDVGRLAENAGRAGSITGRLAASIAINAFGSAADALRRSARGTLDVEITDGAIPGLDMVRTLVLAFGKPSGVPPEGSGSAFTRLGGVFDVEGPVLRTDSLAFASRDFDMHGRARLATDTGALDAATTVLLSRELTAQAGTDLRRYAIEDGRVIVPARISGTLANPSISLDLAAAAQRALENELKRRAKDLLNDLFRRRKGGGG